MATTLFRKWGKAKRRKRGGEPVESTVPAPGGETVTVPFNPPLRGRTTGKEYTGGIIDDQLHRMATEAGHEGIHTSTWGRNANEYYVEDALKAWHDVQSGLIGHEYRRDVQGIDEVLERLSEDTDKAAQDAADAVDRHGDLELEREELHLGMARGGLEPPRDERDWPLGAKLGGLVIFDLGLLSVAYQVLDLSDERFLGVPFVSETALAASGAVLALILLAHLAGQQIKTGLHHLKLENSRDHGLSKETR